MVELGGCRSWTCENLTNIIGTPRLRYLCALHLLPALSIICIKTCVRQSLSPFQLHSSILYTLLQPNHGCSWTVLQPALPKGRISRQTPNPAASPWRHSSGNIEQDSSRHQKVSHAKRRDSFWWIDPQVHRSHIHARQGWESSASLFASISFQVTQLDLKNFGQATWQGRRDCSRSFEWSL